MEIDIPEYRQKGFRDPDGTLEEYLDWGWQIAFIYQERAYRIDYGHYGGRDVIDKGTNRIVHHVETEKAKDFLESIFQGKKMEDILMQEAYITELY